MNISTSTPLPQITNYQLSCKYRLRSYLDRIAAITGLLAWYERQMHNGLTILMYHRILPKGQCRKYPLQSLVIPTEVFRAQVQWLANHCHIMPVNKALIELEAGNTLDRPLVAITFDDGYVDNFEVAAPILEEHGLHATFFITSGFVEKGCLQWFDRAADAWQHISTVQQKELMGRLGSFQKTHKQNKDPVLTMQAWMTGLKQMSTNNRIEMLLKAESLTTGKIDSTLYRPMSSNQVAALHAHGHEIAAHTVTHPILPLLDADLQLSELKLSAEQLCKWIGAKITGFCYPNGDFDNRTECAVKEAGYDYACTTQSGLNQPGVHPNRLMRLPITMQRTMGIKYEHDAIGFRSELCGFRDKLRQFRTTC